MDNVSHAIIAKSMLIIAKIIIWDWLVSSGSPKNSPMLISVSGKINCKIPVKDSGISLEAKENISNGVTDTIPASQIK